MSRRHLEMDDPRVAQTLRQGKIGILPTDTLYGLVGRAENAQTVQRIYAIKRRKPSKPLIILIGEPDQLSYFGIFPSHPLRALVKKVWPGPVSILFPCGDKAWEYLHRGTGELAFRLPASPPLQALLRQGGPVVAPSANREGEPPVTSIDEAEKEFNLDVDFFVDGGFRNGAPSKLVRLRSDGREEWLR